LRRSYTISKVIYYNRVDCCRNRAAGNIVKLLNNRGRVLSARRIKSGALKTVLRFKRRGSTRPSRRPTRRAYTYIG